MDQEEYLSLRTNRIREEADRIGSLRYADDMMIEIITLLDQEELLPQVGRYYTFIYKPQTPRIEYDEYPLIACTSIETWGFKGLNYHWGTWRNYTWGEVVGKLHIVYPPEVQYLRAIPYQKFQLNT